MFKKIIKTYYNILDNKLENWTLVVVFIAILIVLISLLIRNWDSNLNVLNINKNNILTSNIIEIDWKQYELIR